MKPFLFHLSDDQKKALLDLAQRYEQPIAELIRRAVDEFLANQRGMVLRPVVPTSTHDTEQERE